VHGDLHANNILVRSSDAILIDFEKCEPAPILNDVASLDISVAFDCCYGALLEEWSNWLAAIYSVESVIDRTERPPIPHPLEHQWRCIRYLRRFAREETRSKEYAVLLALHLLRRSTYKKDTEGKTGDDRSAAIQRLAHALLAAQVLIDALTDGRLATP
jgi:hypothetical protein